MFVVGADRADDQFSNIHGALVASARARAPSFSPDADRKHRVAGVCACAGAHLYKSVGQGWRRDHRED